MKRSELAAGQHYLVSGYTDWQTSGPVKRAVVLTADPYLSDPPPRWRDRPAKRPFKVTLPDGQVFTVQGEIRPAVPGERGAGALVAYLDADGTMGADARDMFDVVPLGHVRATWADGTAERARNEARRNARAVASAARRKDYTARRLQVIAAIDERGYKHGFISSIDDSGDITVPVTVAEALIAASDGADAKIVMDLLALIRSDKGDDPQDFSTEVYNILRNAGRL